MRREGPSPSGAGDPGAVTLTWLESPAETDVRAALQRVLPDLAGEELVLRAHLEAAHPQYHRSSATLDGRLVVKYAWSHAAAERLWHEVRVLTALRAVDPPLPVPEVVIGSSDPVLLVTARVPGDWLHYPVASQLAGERLRRTTAGMATFLAALHRAEPLRAVHHAGIPLPAPIPQAPTDALRERFGRFTDEARQARVLRWCDWVDEVLEPASTVVLLHGDFAGHNLMWDHETASVRVVYDFEEAAAGDPAYDFRYLPAQAASLDFFERVRRSYQAESGRDVPVERVMAWHVRTALGDALWRSEAGVELPDRGTPSGWVDELGHRLQDAGCPA